MVGMTSDARLRMPPRIVGEIYGVVSVGTYRGAVITYTITTLHRALLASGPKPISRSHGGNWGNQIEGCRITRSVREVRNIGIEITK